MAEQQKDLDLGPFSQEERAYFDSRGEKDIPAEKPPEAPAAASEAPAQAPAEPTATPAPAPPSPPTPAEAGAPADRKVDYGAFHEERTRRKEAEERARNIELLNARMEERFRAYQDAMRPKPQAPKPPPSPDQDIFGAVKHLANEQRRTTEEINTYKRQITAENQMRQLSQWGAGVEAEFRKKTPDYDAALAHLRQARARELAVWKDMTPERITAQLIAEERELLIRAAQSRVNPAELAYQSAQARGYQKTTPAPAASAPRLDVIEAGQRQSGTLSSVGGGGVTPDMTLEDLVRMPEKEFGAWIAKNPAKFRRLKGATN